MSNDNLYGFVVENDITSAPRDASRNYIHYEESSGGGSYVQYRWSSVDEQDVAGGTPLRPVVRVSPSTSGVSNVDPSSCAGD